jgi:uncharacterized protein YbjT (DUF2867 family)
MVVAADTAAASAARVALVAGATGLVGRAVAAAVLADNTWGAVHLLGRRKLDLQHNKLTQHLAADFAALPALPLIDDVFIALGTTIGQAGSQAAFRAVDFDAVLAVAQAAQKAGATRLGVVSAMGANAHSFVFYNRVKGEMEDALAALNFGTLVIARPSLIAGDRAALNQPRRSGEGMANAVMRLWNPLIPANYKAIGAEQIARALVDAVKAGKPGRHVLLSGAMQRY